MRQGTKILVVDDEINFAESLRDLLEIEGYEASAIYSGHDALDKIKKEKFDIVLLDTKMPVMNGVETFKEIKKINSSLVAIMMTGFAVEDLIKDALNEGVFKVLYKPLDISKLMQYLDSVPKIGGQ